ncbi:IS66 family insertion sequence element accessory protein TnpB [Nannocystis radixulma]|uniref:IS66 family insertion sequence element accessory protein TnpB n=1 Tax=Nannocystis radixulma TaxID=2995305 RepID=UPI00358DA703
MQDFSCGICKCPAVAPTGADQGLSSQKSPSPAALYIVDIMPTMSAIPAPTKPFPNFQRSLSKRCGRDEASRYPRTTAEDDCIRSYEHTIRQHPIQVVLLHTLISAAGAIKAVAEHRQGPRSGALFVFTNRGTNRLKVLWWDKNGYCLPCKRLHQALFRLPAWNDPSDRSVIVDGRGLHELAAAVGPRPDRGGRSGHSRWRQSVRPHRNEHPCKR